ncbi:MAG: EAL domain-containing protein [Lachnospiraceae bacterium]|nr:EAL domain-containing protein [Lachnospiraceae bacterium]
MDKVRKRVAVLMGQADEEFQSGFIRGFSKKTGENDINASIFTMRLKFQDSTEREIGDSAIFHACNFALFDAIVVYADSIQSSGVLEKLDNRLHDDFQGPVLFVDGESSFFPSIWTDCYHPMAALVDYLIRSCDYRDFAYLTGKKWGRQSQMRQQALKDTLEKNGLQLDDDRIYEGDYWYTSGVSCVRRMLDSGKPLPQVVVCANDVMAIGLCEELERKEIRVPDDIAVVGCDSVFEGRTSPRMITSVRLDSAGSGAHAAEQVIKMLDHKEPTSHIDEAPALVCGETSRSKTGEVKIESAGSRRWSWATYDSLMSYSAVYSTYDDDLLIPQDLDSFLQVMWSHLARMRNIMEFTLVLDSAWSAPDTTGGAYAGLRPADSVICALQYRSVEGVQGPPEGDRRFELQRILPDFDEEGEEPVTRVFMPLFFDEKSFGYTATIFRKGSACDKEYRLYLGALARGLEALRRTMSSGGREFTLPGKEQQLQPLKKRADLTRDEKREFKESMKILDNNLFRYFFQPIVSAETGEIYSYEALMRPDSALSISPLNLIRYAKMDGRLYDIERDTLINVLNLINDNEVFRDKKVFINSIPGVLLEDEDLAQVESLIKKHADHVVIEITEQSEMGDVEVEDMKKRYRGLGTRVAIDDYGTGYSNAGNLLRYMPDIVKIDRTLLSDIEKSHQKQHFVREIIDFCHDNGMLALAEGVETQEELRTVIRFGADLIQGYYTGRPAPDPVESINFNVRSEIRCFQQERQDGSNQTVYVAGKANRVLMSNLIKEGITHIQIGEERMTCRDIVIAGAPRQRSNIHVEVMKGYEGVITLENVCFSNIKGRPCIEIGENCRVILILQGSNILNGIGIHVPEGSELRIEGPGNLEIRSNTDGYYGIGAGMDERNGRITFSQDGEIRFNMNGRDGIGIGSGKGGCIEINRGRYNIVMSGECGIGIGAFYGNASFFMQDCEISVDITMNEGVCLGSVYGSSDISIERAAVRIYAAMKRMSAVGSLGDSSSKLTLTDGSLDAVIQMDVGTCIGSLSGMSQCVVTRGGVKIDSSGSRAIALGGYEGRVRIKLDMANVRCDVRSEERTVTYALPEDIRLVDSRCRFIVNGADVKVQ